MKVKYDHIGINYNRSRKPDDYLTERLVQLLRPVAVEKYLDIGCGTGNYTIALSNLGFQFIGMDPSIKMLNQAKQHTSKVEWCLGKAENTGISANSIGGIIATLTLHHWDDVGKSFSELARVLKPNGRIVIFTATPDQMQGYWLNHYFPHMMEVSCKQMPTLEEIKEALNAAELSIEQMEKYQVKRDLEDLFLYSGKHQPERYLNPGVRNGISSFTALANREEVSQGLGVLEQDIASGKIEEVMESYENELGDYLFVVAEKNKN